MISKLIFAIIVFCLPISAWADAYSDYVINNICDDCVVYWRMNETSGTNLANSCTQQCGVAVPSAFDVTTQNTPTLNQSGVSGSRGASILFTATSSEYAEVNHNDGGTGPGDVAGNVSAGCWVKQASAVASVLVSANNSNALAGSGERTWTLLVDSTGLVQFRIFQSANDSSYIIITGSTTHTVGTWFFAAGVWRPSDTNIKVYQNGNGDGNSTSTTGTITGQVNYLDIARRNGIGGQIYADANIQDCFIGARELSSGDLQSLYNLGIGAGASAFQRRIFQSSRLELPRFRDDGYFDRFVSRGYVTGNFVPDVPHPRRFGPYLTFAVLPNGHGQ